MFISFGSELAKKTSVSKNSNIEKEKVTTNNLEKSPKRDVVEISGKKKNIPKQKKKEGTSLWKKVAMGVVALPVAIYGAVVLNRKLRKPKLEDVRKAFTNIFGKEVSLEEAQKYAEKYAEICKIGKTKDFIQALFNQVKEDYGLKDVKTKLNIELLKDSKYKTMLEHTKRGQATPLANVTIFPHTSDDTLIREDMGDAFSTVFHELKHIKQFAEAYRADKCELAIPLTDKQATIRNNLAYYSRLTTPEAQERFWHQIYEDIAGRLLDDKYYKLTPYEKNSPEYAKGIEYARAYANYPKAEDDYNAYKNNLLEKEAWEAGDEARKIYEYVKSIWAL